MKRPRPVRFSYFAWIAALALLYGAYAAYGLPHVIWSYGFQLAGTNDRWDFAARRYTRCTFVGPYGQFTIYPGDGRCPWFVFRRSSDAGGVQ